MHERIVAADYYRAMAQVESRLASNDATPTVPPSAGELLALVDALKNGSLSDGQRETLGALRTGLLQLVR